MKNLYAKINALVKVYVEKRVADELRIAQLKIEDLTPLYILIKKSEGCRLMPYLCPAGVWTCGYGATGWGVVPGRAWTQQQAEVRLKKDAEKFVAGVKQLCPDIIDNNLRVCAISDFAYNLGLGNLKSSTLRKKINSQAYDEVPAQLRRWVYAGGRKLRGLIIRRNEEILLWNK